MTKARSGFARTLSRVALKLRPFRALGYSRAPSEIRPPSQSSIDRCRRKTASSRSGSQVQTGSRALAGRRADQSPRRLHPNEHVQRIRRPTHSPKQEKKTATTNARPRPQRHARPSASGTPQLQAGPMLFRPMHTHIIAQAGTASAVIPHKPFALQVRTGEHIGEVRA